MQETKVTSINRKNIEESVVEVHCLEEQQKIANCRSSVDAVIADYEQQVANMHNQKKGVMQKLFSQEIRFKADDGSEYPEWSYNKVKNVAEKLCVGFVGTCEKYYTSKDKGVPMYRTGNIKAGKLNTDDIKYVEQSFHATGGRGYKKHPEFILKERL